MKSRLEFDAGWFCFCLAIATLPVFAVLSIFGPVANNIAAGSISIGIFAFLLVLFGKNPFVLSQIRFMRMVWLIWFAGSSTILFILAYKNSLLNETFVLQFSYISLKIALLVILANTKQIAKNFPNIESFFAGAGALLIFGFEVIVPLNLTVSLLPMIYDGVLYRLQFILHISQMVDGLKFITFLPFLNFFCFDVV